MRFLRGLIRWLSVPSPVEMPRSVWGMYPDRGERVAEGYNEAGGYDGDGARVWPRDRGNMEHRPGKYRSDP